MIASSDLKSYLKDNQKVLGLFRDNDSILFHRLKDVIKVLWYICDMEDRDGKVDEELEVIFETGFSYLHEQLEMIKIYYNNYFKSNYTEFKTYENIINYLLYLDDLSEALSEKGLYKEEVKQSFTQQSEKLENILQEKKTFEPSLFDEINVIIESHIPHKIEILTTDNIFAMIVDEID